ncbi:MAG: hypothetical protein P8X77_02260 [Maritimibacter sp.]
MRPVLPGDVIQAALALLAAPDPARVGLIRQMLDEAGQADAFRQSTGRAHPDFGTGSLMSAAMTRPRAREPYWDDPDYARCLVMVLQVVTGERPAPAA